MFQSLFSSLLSVGVVLAIVFVAIPMIVLTFLRNVPDGTILLVSWVHGKRRIFRGPCKAFVVPLLTTTAEIPSSVITVDLDITDQTADVDSAGVPRPVSVQVQASGIVSVGDTDVAIVTAANRFFAMRAEQQMATLTDLLMSSGRRAINLLTHDQLFNARATTATAPDGADEGDDPLSVIIRRACSNELTDLGLQFNSLNIKAVVSEVATARRLQAEAEAKANARIAAAEQKRRADEAEAEAQSRAAIRVAETDQRTKEAQLAAQRAVSDSKKALAETEAKNAAAIAHAEAERQNALAVQRAAELRATEIAQASANAEKVKLEAEAAAAAEAIKITKIAEANALGIQKVVEAIKQGGDAYLRYRQIEMLPALMPEIADALASSKMVTIAGGEGGGAAGLTMGQIQGVLHTVLAMDLAQQTGITRAGGAAASGNGAGTRETQG